MEHNQIRPRILVVDDDEAITDLVKTNLDNAGYETYIARSGRAAMGFIHNMSLSALVLDIGMPDMDGFGVLSEMAMCQYTHILPTLMLSANYAAHDVSRAIQLGAKDYLAKPFKNNQLVLRVARLVREPRDFLVQDNVVYL